MVEQKVLLNTVTIIHLWSSISFLTAFKFYKMTPTQVFSIVNLIAIPMWILLIFFPNRKITRFMIDYKIIPLFLSVFYIFYIGQSLISGGGMDFGSLDSVMELFTDEKAVLGGWIHYLAFDLLVGMWIVDKNQTLKISPFLIAPCLVFTFMLGPVGFTFFMIIKSFKSVKS